SDALSCCTPCWAAASWARNALTLSWYGDGSIVIKGDPFLTCSLGRTWTLVIGPPTLGVMRVMRCEMMTLPEGAQNCIGTNSPTKSNRNHSTGDSLTSKVGLSSLIFTSSQSTAQYARVRNRIMLLSPVYFATFGSRAASARTLTRGVCIYAQINAMGQRMPRVRRP